MLAQSRPAEAPRHPGTVARMAEFIQAQEAGAGSVTRDDLLLKFTEAEIDRHFPAAKARAAAGPRR